MAAQSPAPHRWYTPADCAAMLCAVRHGTSYRAPCPVHGGDSTTCLSIREGRDKYGNPCTLLHCFAHDCDILDICDVLGIEVVNLFAIQPRYARETRNSPRAHSPRINRLKVMEEPTPDEIAQILLEEMIVSDPEFIEKCEPARKKMWQLAQTSPKSRAALTRALQAAHLRPIPFWEDLAQEMNG